MISLFSSSEGSGESDEELSKDVLSSENRDYYEDLYEIVRDTAMKINSEAKPTIQGVNIASASHTVSDLKEMQEDLERVQRELIDNYGKQIAYNYIVKCIYTRNQIDTLVEILEVSQDE
jgi:hypothetical protein